MGLSHAASIMKFSTFLVLLQITAGRGTLVRDTRQVLFNGENCTHNKQFPDRSHPGIFYVCHYSHTLKSWSYFSYSCAHTHTYNRISQKCEPRRLHQSNSPSTVTGVISASSSTPAVQFSTTRFMYPTASSKTTEWNVNTVSNETTTERWITRWRPRPTVTVPPPEDPDFVSLFKDPVIRKFFLSYQTFKPSFLNQSTAKPASLSATTSKKFSEKPVFPLDFNSLQNTRFKLPRPLSTINPGRHFLGFKAKLVQNIFSHVQT